MRPRLRGLSAAGPARRRLPARGRAAAGALLLLALGPGPASAQPDVSWRMQSAFPSSLEILGESGARYVESLRGMSGTGLDLRFYEPGALVPPGELLSAVAAGSVDAGWTVPAAQAGRIPAAALFGGAPFGPRAAELLAWLRHGGGDPLRDELYARHGVKGITCFVIPPEGGGWFRRELRGADELRGLRIRVSGLGARVLQKLGVSVQLLAAGQVHGAVQRGVLDGVEGSFPSVDLRLGLHQVAKHYYVPGWHSQAAVGELLVGRDRYAALPLPYRRMIETACEASIAWSLAAGEARQAGALRALGEQHGVSIREWPPEVLARLRQAWDDVAREEAGRDADWKRVWDSYAAFRARYRSWGEHGHLR